MHQESAPDRTLQCAALQLLVDRLSLHPRLERPAYKQLNDLSCIQRVLYMSHCKDQIIISGHPMYNRVQEACGYFFLDLYRCSQGRIKYGMADNRD